MRPLLTRLSAALDGEPEALAGLRVAGDVEQLEAGSGTCHQARE